MGEGALHSGGNDSRERSIERCGPSVKRHVRLDARAPHGCIHCVIQIICSNRAVLRSGRTAENINMTLFLPRRWPEGVSRLPGVSTGPSEARGGAKTRHVQNDAIVKRRRFVIMRDRKTKAVMPELVTPELTLVRVADKEALDKYATARTAAGANYQLMGICRS